MVERMVHGAEGMREFGERLVPGLRSGQVIYLYGELGAGKTTLVSGVMRGLGYRGAVKSPTYTLLEPYELAELSVFHFDLYRLADPGELEALALRDHLEGRGVVVIEWPEKAGGALPAPDVAIRIETVDAEQRRLVMACLTDLGASVCGEFD